MIAKNSVRTLVGVFAMAMLAAGCSMMEERDGQRYEDDPRTDTTSLAEMRMDDAGGPAPAAKPAGLANPVAAPQDAPPPSDRALSDAGPNTPLGKQWVFTSITGFNETLPAPPTNASFLMAQQSGRVVGSTSCNPMSGSFRISIASGTLEFRNLENGSALCAGANARTEDAVISAMVATDGFLLDGKNLSLLSKGNVVAQLTTP